MLRILDDVDYIKKDLDHYSYEPQTNVKKNPVQTYQSFISSCTKCTIAQSDWAFKAVR